MSERIRAGFRFGEISDNPLSDVATSINSPEFAQLPAVSGDNYLVMVLDPNGDNGTPEVVYVTLHVISDTEVFVVRGQTQEGGGAARVHPVGTQWFHGPTRRDYVAISDVEPDDPHLGMLWVDTSGDKPILKVAEEA